jgi:hypothetical protein
MAVIDITHDVVEVVGFINEPASGEEDEQY